MKRIALDKRILPPVRLPAPLWFAIAVIGSIVLFSLLARGFRC